MNEFRDIRYSEEHFATNLRGLWCLYMIENVFAKIRLFSAVVMYNIMNRGALTVLPQWLWRSSAESKVAGTIPGRSIYIFIKV